jgi:MFS family permease
VSSRSGDRGTGRRRQLTFAVLAAGTLLYTVSLALVTPVLAQVRDNLGTSQNGATWVLTSYLISAAALTPISGRLGDIIGKKRMLVIALTVSTAGLVIAALSTSLLPMIVGRAVQGLGGGIVPLGFGIVRDELSREKVGRAVSVLSSMTAAGAALGVVLAGPIVEGLGYHWLFWLPAIGSGLTAAAAFVVIPASRVRAPGSIAWGAALLLSSWLVALLIAISQGPRLGLGAPLVLGCSAAALVLCGCWVRCELRARTPLIDLRMLRATTLWTTNVMAFLSGSAMFASMAFTTQLTQTPPSHGYGFGLSLTMAGVVQLPTSGAGFVLGMLISRLVPPLDPKWISVGAVAMLTCGLLGLAFLHDEIWQVCLANALTGGGLGAAAACQATLISTAVEPQETGAANGVSMTIRVIGGTIGTAAMSSIIASHVASGATLPDERGYAIGFTVLAATTAAGALAALAIPRGSRSRQVDAERI